jgi:zinc finger MYND domain-containing protein 15
MGGWKGGTSTSASTVNIQRRSFQEGFLPLTDVPLEMPLSDEERSYLPQNSLGFARLSSWADYYKLRRLSTDSLAALLLSFPLTMYYAIVEYGEVPCTVARLLGRALRIHLVGSEKELNLLDLFKEVCFLLPTDISIEIVVVTRNDMIPPALRSESNRTIRLLSNLELKIVCGTYGSASLDPNFDCGSGPPDMIMAFNAGLFAYKSWRPVVEYLDQHRGVVGVFTDYNEFSGVQCASLGGPSGRNSLQMNPFRQPRAMPGKTLKAFGGPT